MALIASLALISISLPMAGRVAARPAGELAADQPGRPLALAAADFDEDGVADLVTGFVTASGSGVVTVRLGNADTIYPHTPAARARRRAGRPIASPFLPGARAFALPAAPDFLHAGDFDADGHFDLIGAAAGGAAVVLRGDGTGSLAPAEPIALSGAVGAMAVGDINGPDGLADVVFAVTDRTGSRLAVFAGYQGAWRSSPAVFDLPAPATAVALATLDEHAADIAVAAGHELLVVHGRAGRARAATSRTSAAAIERRSLPFAAAAMVAGDFTGDRRADLALASADGAVHLLARPEAAAGAAGPDSVSAPLEQWTVESAAEGVAGPGLTLVRARVSNRTADDLLVVNRGEPLNRPFADGRGEARPVVAIAAAAVLPMRLDADARDDLVILRPGQPEPAVELTLPAASRVVVNTNDSGPGSLRQAILDSNAENGDDLITFDIPGAGPHVITPATPLPPMVPDTIGDDGAVVIDGTSEPGFAGAPIIELSGALVGTAGDGLTFGTSGCVVRGLVINRFAAGILYTSAIDRSTGVAGGVVEGNYLGTDLTGTTALGNQTGLVLGVGAFLDGVSDITVGGTAPAARNVISGNGLGISATSGGGHLIMGNFIGTDASGAVALGNTGRGIINFSFSGEIGGSRPGARNVIAANGDDGVTVTETGLVLVSHNYIGTDLTGTVAMGNHGDGVDVPDATVTIADNVIAANGGHGVSVPQSFSTVDILRNRIGTSAAGTGALGNDGDGINAIGFNRSISGNLVSGNGGHGIVVRGLENVVQQNLVGTDITGTAALGNRGDGVHVLDLANVIGGEGLGNVVAFNGGGGVVTPLPFTTAISIVSNAIFSNGGLGIDLGADGVTPNDACDAGEVVRPNFPVLTAVTSSSSATTIAGQLNSLPDKSFVLQFFSSPAADSTGFGEGARLLGSASVTTDSACNATFTVTVPVAVAANHFVTATATSTTEFPTLTTSEFSNAVRFVPQTSEEAIRQIIGQVRTLVAQGELGRLAGFALTVKLQAALFFVERDNPRAAAVQLRGFIVMVEVLVKVGHLDPVHGQALVDAARAILSGLETS
jgi:hypothetical protein